MTARDAIPPSSILCVDADANVHAFLRSALPEHDLAFATSGFEALKAVNTRSFNAYILEYWLPDWSGRAFCRELRSRDPYVPIVFCAATAEEVGKARCLRVGANSYLTKPVEAEALRTQIVTLLADANAASLTAKFEEECAIADELARRVAILRQRVDAARNVSASSIERAARAKALKAYLDARGTLAHFDVSWPHVYSRVRTTQAMWY